MLLPKQQAQAKAWRLFIVSGSLTWFRRPRLASFTSTTIVETIHPLVTSQPIWLKAQCTGHGRNFVSADFFGVADRSRDVASGVALGDGLSSVLCFLALSERQLDFGLPVFEVQLERDHRQRFGTSLVLPLVQFAAVRQEFATAIGVVTAETGRVDPRWYVHLIQPNSVSSNRA
jgi:hypothetical protein